MTDDELTAITCTFSWGDAPGDRPCLSFLFHPDIDPENIKAIALVMAKTAAAKMDCLNFCAAEQEICDGQHPCGRA